MNNYRGVTYDLSKLEMNTGIEKNILSNLLEFSIERGLNFEEVVKSYIKDKSVDEKVADTDLLVMANVLLNVQADNLQSVRNNIRLQYNTHEIVLMYFKPRDLILFIYYSNLNDMQWLYSRKYMNKVWFNGVTYGTLARFLTHFNIEHKRLCRNIVKYKGDIIKALKDNI